MLEQPDPIMVIRANVRVKVVYGAVRVFRAHEAPAAGAYCGL